MEQLFGIKPLTGEQADERRKMQATTWIHITYEQLVTLVLMETYNPPPAWPAPITEEQLLAAEAFSNNAEKQARDAWNNVTSEQQMV